MVENTFIVMWAFKAFRIIYTLLQIFQQIISKFIFQVNSETQKLHSDKKSPREKDIKVPYDVMRGRTPYRYDTHPDGFFPNYA